VLSYKYGLTIGEFLGNLHAVKKSGGISGVFLPVLRGF